MNRFIDSCFPKQMACPSHSPKNHGTSVYRTYCWAITLRYRIIFGLYQAPGQSKVQCRYRKYKLFLITVHIQTYNCEFRVWCCVRTLCLINQDRVTVKCGWTHNSFPELWTKCLINYSAIAKYVILTVLWCGGIKYCLVLRTLATELLFWK